MTSSCWAIPKFVHHQDDCRKMWLTAVGNVVIGCEGRIWSVARKLNIRKIKDQHFSEIFKTKLEPTKSKSIRITLLRKIFEALWIKIFISDPRILKEIFQFFCNNSSSFFSESLSIEGCRIPEEKKNYQNLTQNKKVRSIVHWKSQIFTETVFWNLTFLWAN
jgi:hypothetical protein